MTAERQTGKPEISAQKRSIKLAPALGDWTTYKPPQILVKKVKTGLYGFDRLSKKELTATLFIHYRFVQQLLKKLKVDLGMAVELFQTQVEQNTYLSFLRGLSGPVVQCRVTAENLAEPILLFIEQTNANTIINYALGSVDLEPISRGLTEAEKITLKTALDEYLPLLNASFNQTLGNLQLTIISSPDVIMDPTINPNSTLAAFSADISLADNAAAKITIAYPGGTLKNLLNAYEQIEDSRPLDFARLSAKLLAKIFVPIKAILGETTLTTNELQNFESGDVISLDVSTAEPVSLAIGEEVKLSCQPGLKNKKLAARLLLNRDGAGTEVPPPTTTSTETPAPTHDQTPAPVSGTEAPMAEAVPVDNLADIDTTLDEGFNDASFSEENFDEDILDEDTNAGQDFSTELPEDKLPENGL